MYNSRQPGDNTGSAPYVNRSRAVMTALSLEAHASAAGRNRGQLSMVVTQTLPALSVPLVQPRTR